MRLATIIDAGLPRPVAVRDDRVLPIAQPLNELAERGLDSLPRVEAWVDAQPAASWRPLERVRLGPAVADPGAIYTVGLNYDGPGAAPRPERPLIYGKAAGSVAGHGATLGLPTGAASLSSYTELLGKALIAQEVSDRIRSHLNGHQHSLAFDTRCPPSF